MTVGELLQLLEGVPLRYKVALEVDPNYAEAVDVDVYDNDESILIFGQ